MNIYSARGRADFKFTNFTVYLGWLNVFYTVRGLEGGVYFGEGVVDGVKYYGLILIFCKKVRNFGEGVLEVYRDVKNGTVCITFNPAPQTAHFHFLLSSPRKNYYFNSMSTIKLDTIQENILERLFARKKMVDTLVEKLSADLKNAPKEHLQVSKNKNTYQYYLKNEFSSKKGSYIPKRDIEKAKQIAQRDYNSKLLKKLLVEQKALNKVLTFFKFTDIYKEYDSLHPARKVLVTPVVTSPEEFAANWQAKTYKTTSYHKENLIFKTNNNEYVRSKSELVIANALAFNKIPYKYAPEYATAAAEKFLSYTQNGFQQGRNIIYTTETKTAPLTPNTVQKIIDAFLI